MSHNFKRPASIDPQDRRDDRTVKMMALHIPDQATLDKLLDGARPILREAMLAALAPYLTFVPAGPVMAADCPNCGLRRGTLFAHECVEAAR